MADQSDDNQGANNNEDGDFAAVTSILEILKKLSESSRVRVMSTVGTFLKIPYSNTGSAGLRPNSNNDSSTNHFSADRSLTPKQFMVTKLPKTDVERVACLAFYLTHYKDSPHFKTLEISKLNTEAAQPKFANAAKAVDNATTMGYLVQAPKGGYKQISAGGEIFVQALPDREAAKASMKNLKPRKANRSKVKSEKKADEA